MPSVAPSKEPQAASRSKATATKRVTADVPRSVAASAGATAGAPSAPAQSLSHPAAASAREAGRHPSASVPTQPPAASLPLVNSQPVGEPWRATASSEKDVGWETSKGKSRRRSKSQAAQQAATPLSTQPNQYSLTQLKAGLPADGPTLEKGQWGRILSTSNCDEARSDETIPLNEDDWSSSSASEQEQRLSTDSSKVTTRVSSSRRKRAMAKVVNQHLSAQLLPADKGASEKPQPNASIATQWMSAMGATCVSTKFGQLLKLPLTHLLVQSVFVVLALLVLCAMPTQMLPPTVPQLEALHWLEIPLGVALAVKLPELSNVVQSICTPMPSLTRAA
uniref:Uncharacterized protein n=1 Tax=Coccolithus braarudii TaxID=221442 RepID=A0A7S0PZR2_9EUKA|mmetsp:Transcript_31402/g.67512  ORF Transcript_31402/g.67512 Transcript_31402/m.67512 type:complete len:336 (+) Transcript_31402:2-1009(+)